MIASGASSDETLSLHELHDLSGQFTRPRGLLGRLVDRVLAATCLAAYPDRPITADLIAEQIRANPPTRPFAERR